MNTPYQQTSRHHTQATPIDLAQFELSHRPHVQAGHTIPTHPEAQAHCILSQDPALLSEAQRLAQRLMELPIRYEGIPPRVLAVGGFVRDALLGLAPKDLDLEVYGVHPNDLEQVLDELFPGTVNTTGKSFCVFKVALPNGYDIDVSIPRTENSTGPGTKDFEVVGKPDISIEEAARRRDFTMNALAADVLDGTVFDTYNGVQHLAEGILSVTDPTSFQEDPLRIYRGIQFCARMNLTPDVEARCLMKVMTERGDLEHLAPERVTEEFAKLLLKGKSPSQGFAVMRDLGVLARHYPELDALTRCEQDPEWHPEGTVWNHTMTALDMAATIVRESFQDADHDIKLAVLYGTLCHDLGKARTTIFKDGHIRSPGHDNAGVPLTHSFFNRLAVPNEVRNLVATIVKLHMRPGALQREHEQGVHDDQGYVNKLRMLLRELSPSNKVKSKDEYLTRAEAFLAVCESDHRGRDLADNGQDPFPLGTEIRSLVSDHDLDNQPLLRGRDLQELGLTPGKEFGSILEGLETARDKGRLCTREDALNFVRRTYLVRGADIISRGVTPGPQVGSLVQQVRSLILDGTLAGRADVLSYLSNELGDVQH